MITTFFSPKQGTKRSRELSTVTNNNKRGKSLTSNDQSKEEFGLNETSDIDGPSGADGVIGHTTQHLPPEMSGVDETWINALSSEFQKPYFTKLQDFVHAERKSKTIYPPAPMVYAALEAVPLPQVRVVILGQDPYHGPGQAHGLSFSVPEGIAIPGSLRNILKEVQADCGITATKGKGYLMPWAKQGVLLLNTVLTVEARKAFSHRKQGWETFTDAVIRAVGRQKHVVFMLWGKPAHEKAKLVDPTEHCILKAAHPSPLSAHRGFLGCKHFSQANEYLKKHGRDAIDWSL